MISSESKSRAFWICAVITSFNALVSSGYSIASLLVPGFGEAALYLASRCIALVLVALGMVWLRSRIGIAALAFTVGLVQVFDTGIGILAHDSGKTLGPLVLAVATFTSVVYLLREIKQGAQRTSPPTSQ